MRATAFQEIAADFQGTGFEIPDIAGNCVVSCILDETRTDEVATQLGLPRDLDGDLNPTSVDVSGVYTLLPIHVQITWTNRRGDFMVRDHYVLLSPEE